MTLNDKKTERSGFVWNLIGSTVYSAVNMLLGTMVIRVLGSTPGGIFFFAFSTVGQHIYTIAYFCVRPLHIMDITGKYSFGDYRQFRFLTGAAALAAAVIFAVLYSGTSYKTAIIVILAVYKILDAVADVYESEYQRDGRLDLTGKSITIRTLFAAACFLTVMLLTGDLMLSCLAAVGAILLAIPVCCAKTLRHSLSDVDYVKREGSEKKIFENSRWLFAASFIDLYIFLASKYAVDAYMGAEASAYYSTIFVPTSAILLMSNFVIRPALTKLSEYYENEDYRNIIRMFRRLSLMITGLTAFGMLFSWLFGIQILTFLVGSKAGTELAEFKTALVIIIGGGGMYAMLTLIYYIVIILQKQKALFLVYAAAVVPAFALSVLLVKKMGINGGALSYLAGITAITAALFVIAMKDLTKKVSGGCHE